jgi:hypothetical protein
MLSIINPIVFCISIRALFSEKVQNSSLLPPEIIDGPKGSTNDMIANIGEPVNENLQIYVNEDETRGLHFSLESLMIFKKIYSNRN